MPTYDLENDGWNMNKESYFAEPASVIRKAREDHGHSLRHCARVLEISPGYWSKVELGHQKPSPRILHQFCRLYDVPIFPIFNQYEMIDPETEDRFRAAYFADPFGFREKMRRLSAPGSHQQRRGEG